jgi:hypothetical protein
LRSRVSAKEAARLRDRVKATRRIEQIIDDLRREKFGPSSDKLSPDWHGPPT